MATSTERARARRAAGLCITCLKKHKSGRARCQKCHDRCLAAQRKSRRERTARNICPCGKPPVAGKRLCKKCQKVQVTITRARMKRYRAAGLCCCGKPPVTGKKSCGACLETFRRAHQKLRDEVFAAYGGYICKCCDETIPEFLELDHIDNNGGSHRRKIGSGMMYRWLKTHGFPPGYQVLCSNCHFARHRHGRCPHEALKLR